MRASCAALALAGCIHDAQSVDPDGPRLALYAVPSSLSDIGLLTLVGAKLIDDDQPTKAFCLRLTAERGTVRAPGGTEKPASRDGSAASADADSGARSEGCPAPRCFQTEFVTEGERRVAYAVYAADPAAANDIVIGAAYAASCAAVDGGPVARATLLLYPAGPPGPGPDAEVPDAGAPDGSSDLAPDGSSDDGQPSDAFQAADAFDGGTRS